MERHALSGLMSHTVTDRTGRRGGRMLLELATAAGDMEKNDGRRVVGEHREGSPVVVRDVRCRVRPCGWCHAARRTGDALNQQATLSR